jgi:hypothetical protein
LDFLVAAVEATLRSSSPPRYSRRARGAERLLQLLYLERSSPLATALVRALACSAKAALRFSLVVLQGDPEPREVALA